MRPPIRENDSEIVEFLDEFDDENNRQLDEITAAVSNADTSATHP